MSDDDDLAGLRHSSAPVEQRDLYAVMQILRAHHRETASWLAVTLVTVTALQLVILGIIALAYWGSVIKQIVRSVGV